MLYVTGLYYLSFIVNLLLINHYSPGGKKLGTRLALATFITVFLKCHISGFDYIIPTVVMALIPIAMYAYICKWTVWRTLVITIGTGFASMLAVLCGLAMLTLQLSHYYHSLTDAVDYIITTSERRTYGNQQELIQEYNASKNTTFMDIMVRYSTAVAVDLKHMSNGLLNQVQIRFLSFFLYFFIAALCLPVIRKRMATGLFIAMILSLTGPLGWFIIFKYHAISHTHMNFILWYMPLMLFGPVFVGYICHQLVILSIAKVNQFIHLRKL